MSFVISTDDLASSLKRASPEIDTEIVFISIINAVIDFVTRQLNDSVALYQYGARLLPTGRIFVFNCDRFRNQLVKIVSEAISGIVRPSKAFRLAQIVVPTCEELRALRTRA